MFHKKLLIVLMTSALGLASTSTFARHGADDGINHDATEHASGHDAAEHGSSTAGASAKPWRTRPWAPPRTQQTRP